MFVADEVILDIGFTAAYTRLTNLIDSGLLAHASTDSYRAGLVGLSLDGPPGAAPDASRPIKARFRHLAIRDDSAVLAFRWEHGHFPVLDADITLIPDGPRGAVLRLTAVYRPPRGPASQALNGRLPQVATATVQAFLGWVADAMAHPAAGADHEADTDGLVLAWLLAEPDQ